MQMRIPSTMTITIQLALDLGYPMLAVAGGYLITFPDSVLPTFGTTGPIGSQGPIGYTGAAGSPGAAGAKGDKGNTGLTGPTGLQGATGPQGTQGIQGVQGVQGITGETGNTGLQGETGLQGDASTVAGPTGPDGPQGIQGIQGVQGEPSNLVTLGVTATAAELNFVAGVTSALQTQLGTKQATIPAPAAWTPTLGGVTIGAGTVIARFLQINKFVFFEFSLTLAADTSITGSVTFTLPVSVKYAHAIFNNSADATGYQNLLSGLLSGAGCTVYAVSVSGSYLRTTTVLSATVPITWAIGDQIYIAGAYEAA